MELQELLAILRATVVGHRRMILQLCIWSTLAALLLSFLMPDRYEATALVMVRPQESIDLGSQPAPKEFLELPAGSTLQSDTPSKTYIEVIKSRSVAEQVVRQLSLDRREAMPENPTLADRAKGIVKDVILGTRDLGKYGRLIDVSPSEKAVRRLMKNISLTPVRDTFVFEITYESGDPDEAFEVANEAASVFVDISNETSVSEARSSREFIGAQVAETEQALERARTELRDFKDIHRSVAFDEERTERIRGLRELDASLAEADAKLEELLGRYTDANPRVRSARARRDALTGSVAGQRKTLREMPEQEAQLARLDLAVSTLEGNYKLLQKHFEEARLRESRRGAEIRVVSPAARPAYPVGPIKVYYAGAGLALALFVGFGIGLAVELLDTRLRTVEEVERLLGISVIATTPRMQPD